VFGEVAAESAVERVNIPWPELSAEQVDREEKRVFAFLQPEPSPIRLTDLEYKVRRIAGDYAAPPKNEYKLDQAICWMGAFRQELQTVKAADLHELMKVHEIGCIIDCVELSAIASKHRKESRWGYFHQRTDYPEKNDAEWLKHVVLTKNPDDGSPAVSFRPIERSVL
jgi:succinate dehydrogenase/fumarate reductase flavoprotein subunit